MPRAMSRIPREFFTVDLRGLRAALAARAAERGMTESDVLRSALAVALSVDGSAAADLPSITAEDSPTTTHVKLSVRLSRPVAHRLESNARATGLSRGAYLTGLIDGAPAITPAEHHAGQVAALVASTVELAVISRDINDLARLIRRGSIQAAREYWGRLMSLDADVQKHLTLAAGTLADLRSVGRAPCSAGAIRVDGSGGRHEFKQHARWRPRAMG